MKIKFYSKIVLILVFVFFLSSFLGKNLFLSYTPKIRTSFFADIRNLIKVKTGIFLSYFNKPNNLAKTSSESNKEQIYDNLMKNLKPVGKGVEAATYQNYSYIKVDPKKVEWTEIEIKNQDGTFRKINVPKKY
jgi:hypothetical protein